MPRARPTPGAVGPSSAYRFSNGPTCDRSPCGSGKASEPGIGHAARSTTTTTARRPSSTTRGTHQTQWWRHDTGEISSAVRATASTSAATIGPRTVSRADHHIAPATAAVVSPAITSRATSIGAGANPANSTALNGVSVNGCPLNRAV